MYALCSAAGGLSLLPPCVSSTSAVEFIVAVKDPSTANVVEQSVNLTGLTAPSSIAGLVNMSGGWDRYYNNLTSVMQ